MDKEYHLLEELIMNHLVITGLIGVVTIIYKMVVIV